MTAPRPATLTDVARAAGVSLATASRVLNGSDRVVGSDLRDRVLAAALELGYTANAQAQAVARGTTAMVGLLVNDIADPYFSTIAGGLAAAAEEHGLLVMLCNTGGNIERELQFLATLRSQRSRAIVLAGSGTTDEAHHARLAEQLAGYARAGGRAAAITQPRLPVDTVVPENHAGAAALAERLAGLGYRRAAVLAGPDDLLVSRERREGFRETWRAVTGHDPVVFTGAFSRDGGHRAMREALAAKTDLDCVFAVNDLMAVGALAACREEGLAVGRDLGVAGFDDIATLRDVTPPLTTVRLPLAEMGRLALELVTATPSPEPRRRPVGGEVVVRESTPPRGT